jgi:hypothetical protein
MTTSKGTYRQELGDKHYRERMRVAVEKMRETTRGVPDHIAA